jgi:hypothetical protein
LQLKGVTKDINWLESGLFVIDSENIEVKMKRANDYSPLHVNNLISNFQHLNLQARTTRQLDKQWETGGDIGTVFNFNRAVGA